MSTFKSNALSSNLKRILTNGALLTYWTYDSLKFWKLGFSESFGNFANFLPKLEKLFIAHLININIIILIVDGLPEFLLEFFVMFPQLFDQRQHLFSLLALSDPGLNLAQLISLVDLFLPELIEFVLKFSYFLIVANEPLNCKHLYLIFVFNLLLFRSKWVLHVLARCQSYFLQGGWQVHCFGRNLRYNNQSILNPLHKGKVESQNYLHLFYIFKSMGRNMSVLFSCFNDIYHKWIWWDFLPRVKWGIKN